MVFDCTRNDDGCNGHENQCQQQCSDYYTFSLPTDGRNDASVTPKSDIEGCTCYDGTWSMSSRSSDITFSDGDQAHLQDQYGNPLSFFPIINDAHPQKYFIDGEADLKVELLSVGCHQSFACTMRCKDKYCADNPSVCGCGDTPDTPGQDNNYLFPGWVYYIIIAVVIFIFCLLARFFPRSDSSSSSGSGQLLERPRPGYGGSNYSSSSNYNYDRERERERESEKTER